jgi:hypothetical protein
MMPKTGILPAAIAGSSILIAIMPSHSYAIKMFSDDQLSIDTAIQDDIIASGGTVNINAPVDSAIIVGGTVNVNAPVDGDLIATGGQITINSDVRGKIVAAGGNIDLKGDAKNIVVAGGNVKIHPGSVIARDAVMAGGTVENAGEVTGKITVAADNFQNTGTAGEIEIREDRANENMLYILQALFVLGFGVLGVVLTKLFPLQLVKIDGIIRKSPIKNTVVGFLLIIASAVAIVVSAVTIVGLPIAIVSGLLFVVALMVAGLFVAFTLGNKIIAVLRLRIANKTLAFIIGFAALALLYLIPYAGQAIQIVVVSLGFGALFYGLRQNWAYLTSEKVA